MANPQAAERFAGDRHSGTERGRPAPRLAWVAWLAVCTIWGTTYLGIRICLETMPPALMGGLRWTLAGGLIVGVLAARGVQMPARQALPGLALLGLLMIGVGNGLVVWAEQFVPSGLTAVILASSPFWMVGIDAALPRGDAPTRLAVLGLVVGFGGIVLLVWPDLQAGGTESARFGAGIIALQVACIGWALGSAWSRRHVVGGSVFGAAALQMLFGGVLMLVIGSAAGEWQALHFSPRTTVAFVYLTLVGSIGGYVAYIYALQHLPVSTVSLYAYVNPVIAVLLGALVLAEPLDARIALAAGLVLAGLALVKLGAPRAPRHRRSAGAHARPDGSAGDATS